MSQQGGRPTARPEDDWWGQLYDDATGDTGPTTAPDSLDDRFTSARNTVRERPGRSDPQAPPPDDSATATAPPDVRLPSDGSASEPDASRSDASESDVPSRAGASGSRDVSSLSDDPAPSDGAALSGVRRPSDVGAPVDGSSWGEVPVTASDAPESSGGAAPTGVRRPSDAVSPADAPPWGDVPGSPDGPAPADTTAPTDVPGTSVAPDPIDLPASPGAPSPLDLPAPPDTRDPTDLPTLQVLPVQSARPDLPARRSASEPPSVPEPASALDFLGSGPPTYDPEPTALPHAEPEELGELVADTVLDGARYGTWTLRSVSLRGDSARYRGEPRRDALLTARFGTGDHALVLVAMATGARATPEAHLAAAEACRWIGRAVGRSHQRLAEDIRATRRADLKAGLHRLTDRSLGRLRASALERGARPEEYTATLRCLLLPADPHCRTRVFFGVGDGGLFQLRDGSWRDIEPRATEPAPPEPPGTPEPAEEDDDRLTLDLGVPQGPYEQLPEPPPPPARDPFRFQVSLARPGDALLMCTPGLAEPLRGEPALSAYLSRRWSGRRPPGLAAFLADARVRVKGYADDRTAAALWEA
nr:protein phosphatase 2C domain-containing protein [Streptomyces griseofuscus]